MKGIPLLPRYGRDSRFWLGVLAIGLSLLHLVLTWRLLGQTDQLILNALFWAAILHRFWHPQEGLRLTPDRSARFLGWLVLSLLLVKSLSLVEIEAITVRLFPAVAVLGLGLLCCGWALWRCWQIGLLLLPLLLPRTLLEQAIEAIIGQPLQKMTAQAAAFGLHYLGFDPVRQGATIKLEQGSVEVLFRCTGVPLLILLLQLALLFMVLFPLSRQQQLQVVLMAGLISFLLSSGRVALMAMLVHHPIAFDYWHGGAGAQMFSTGAIVLFGWFCHRLGARIQ